MLDRVLRIGLLIDFYGVLLTDKQQQCLEMHYLNDFSLSEIAEELNVSRQAVHDILKRAEQTLEDYENKLGLLERYKYEQGVFKTIYNALMSVPEELKNCEGYSVAVSELKKLLEHPRGGAI